MRLTNYIIVLLVSLNFFLKAQPANYVSNGNLEELIGCCNNNPNCFIKYWLDIDTFNIISAYPTYCTGNPNYNFGYQLPRSGNTFIVFDIYCPSCQFPFTRTYIKNRLKSKLVKNQSYCVKFWVNIANNSTYGSEGFDAYFGDNAFDTVTKKHLPITFVNPQIKNPSNNMITDTLKWTAVTGTFTADGSEKFLIIGDFRNNTSTVPLYTPSPTHTGTEICLDDVSCIPIDLPAAAGPDRHFLPGEKIYLGRERDVEIDESCVWYKLPNMSMPIDTGAGIFVSPAQTSTYVVRQQLWCSGVKWDTVVVYQDFVGLPNVSQQENNASIKIYPNPANTKINLEYAKGIFIDKINFIDFLGRVVYTAIEPKNEIEITNLQTGIYYLKIQTNKNTSFFKLQIE